MFFLFLLRGGVRCVRLQFSVGVFMKLLFVFLDAQMGI